MKLIAGHIIAAVALIIAVLKSTGCVVRGSKTLLANLNDIGLPTVMYSDENRPSEGQLADMKSRLLEKLEKLI